ncbi:multiple sugar transport system permease protein [Actinopolymorpha cephalotaxi]|uniref:Multiple sugar transport system permease protein n=1 Tax=Actinopolymorpha cephalotaxi TaxID=504797 RepID=A0A1I2SR39_9ACTN|nr:sugar ABC transporter permease [Actinopolymorpha cephalotaxi]NYH83989.1 multiple sugar transport system permease protein [Actinopolymorpha cephalotaxi]SFG52626.1 multiple sugar transport system permease protein [Actinopolymorpha cephalotaxi]
MGTDDRTSRRLGQRPRRHATARRNLRNGLLFISPWLVGLVVLQAYPFFMTAYYAFTDFDGLNFPPHWIGIQNFSTLFTADPQFWPSVTNTLWWVVTSVPTSIVVGVLLALLLNRRVRGLGIFRTVFYLPAMVPFVGGSVLFLWLFNPAGGAINSILGGLGLGSPGWFSDPSWAKPTLLLLQLWQVGPSMIIFLAGLQDIPAELYEAASIDGASAFRKFCYITLPLLTPAIFFNLVLGTIWAFSYFTQALVVSAAPSSLGGSHAPGGPADSTLFYSLYLYTQIFQNFRLGYGAAMSLLLTLVVIILAAVLFRTGRRWVFYYDHQA